MANVMNARGYYQMPVAPSPIAAGGGLAPSPQFPGQAPAMVSSRWVPTSASDPYVAGLRTSGSAMAAIVGASRAATNAKWNAMMKARAAAGLTRGGKTLAAAGESAASRATYMAGKGFGAAKTAVKGPGLIGAFRHTFLSLSNVGKAMAGAAIIAVPIALITNYLDYKAKLIDEKQRNALIVADVAGYTITGASSTLIGGAIGTTFLGPMIGTVVGVAAGFALGWVYENKIRPQWGKMVQDALYPPVVAPPAPIFLPK